MNKPTFFGDIMNLKSQKNNGSQQAYVDKNKLWEQGGQITICFEQISSPTAKYVTAGISAIGTDSNMAGGPCPKGNYKKDGKFYNNCNEPSMKLAWTDPPITSFTSVDGIIHPLSAFKYEKRTGCWTDALGNVQCDSDVVPGVTVLHEFLHALGAHHEHLNPQNRPFTMNKDAIYKDLCPTGDKTCIDSANINWLYGYGEISSLSDYDPKSIMTYSVPSKYIIGTDPSKTNYVLSEKDRQWLKDMYPNSVDIKVAFANGKPWQKDWVKKKVLEDIAPYTKIKFSFVDGSTAMCGENVPPESMPLASIFLMSGIVLGSILLLWIIGIIFVKRRLRRPPPVKL